MELLITNEVSTEIIAVGSEASFGNVTYFNRFTQRNEQKQGEKNENHSYSLRNQQSKLQLIAWSLAVDIQEFLVEQMSFKKTEQDRLFHLEINFYENYNDTEFHLHKAIIVRQDLKSTELHTAAAASSSSSSSSSSFI
ncbi:Hypothetical predicted protein [Octopus vulgaris]|uniref:Uncharacterized protein n=1 Tax=Octopus vulgaris TaxID=6645 RepID=A0AA36EZK4_OCTVU|nr:Hypothetical predicted protein [Octopus vulgaris]